MKKNTKTMLVAGAAIAIALILGVFAEIGIACVFNIQVEGIFSNLFRFFVYFTGFMIGGVKHDF